MTADLFAVLDLPRSFDIDLADLEKRYYQAQRCFHPDRLIGKSAAERQAAIAQSMLVNEAYEALKTPLKRAQHLLLLAGIAHDSAKPSHELLMEIMELREALMEVESAANADRMAKENEQAIAATQKELSQLFAEGDLTKAAQSAMRLSYLVKLADEIRIKKKSVAA